MNSWTFYDSLQSSTGTVTGSKKNYFSGEAALCTYNVFYVFSNF